MPSSEKVQKVQALTERIEGSEALLLAEFSGLSVTDAADLRRSLRDAGAAFSVVKNSLMKRAAEAAGMAELEGLLEGPTAVAFIEGDAVAAAKSLSEAARRFPALVLKGGFMEGRVLSAHDAQALSRLESREVMLARTVGLMKGEMSRAAGMFQALQARFLSLMEALKDKLPGEAEPTEEAKE